MLDTCTLIWLCSDPGKLSHGVRHLLEDETNRLLLGDVSAMEVSLKWAAGKLHLPAPPRLWLEDQLRVWTIESVALTREDMYRSAELPSHHRDPFDRLLVATAIRQSATILTPDEHIRAYPVACEW